MLYLFNLFFIFSLIFIVINQVTLLKQTQLLFVHYFQLAKVHPQGVALSFAIFCQLHSGIAYKIVACEKKKRVYHKDMCITLKGICTGVKTSVNL